MSARFEDEESFGSLNLLEELQGGMDRSEYFSNRINNEEYDEREDVQPKLATKETQTVLILRVLFALVLFGVAIGVSMAVLLYSRENEKQDFEQAFANFGGKIVDHFLVNAKRRVGAIDNLSLSITSHALSSRDRFPLVTLPDFERRVTGVLDQAQIVSLTYMPVVTNETRFMWETYSVYKQGWFLESFDVRKEEQEKRFGADNVEDEEAESLAALETVGDGLDKAFRINPKIYRIDGQKAGPETSDGPYLPVWQFAPNIPISDVINFNILSHPSYANEAASCKKHEQSVIGRAFDFSNETNPEVAFRKSFLNLFLNRWKHGGNDYKAGPVSDLYTPVFDHYGKNKTIAGMLLANVYWSIYFNDILAENVVGVVAVLENKCGQAYTYAIDGTKASYIGPGDLHEPSYDAMEQSTGFGAFLPGEGRDSIEYNCAYNLRVYPSLEMEKMYYTNTPFIFAGGLLCAFLFTSIIFLAYDRCSARRQNVLKRTAEQSTEVISSLFPDQVRDRLFENKGTGSDVMSEDSCRSTHQSSATSILSRAFARGSSLSSQNATTRRRSSAALCISPLDAEELQMHDSLPIADFYENCTVFFADISGFTHWSSTRPPQEVFMLLETLYGCFDRTAKRLHVFKIETIGDCYVAVAGLPNPQAFHAVIMASFAAQVLLDMSQVCNRLVGLLGQETALLGLRVGIHSGPVTAGVLRGEKARFQLFGDTVNTAARMESNSTRGKIQASQQTADLIRAAGKGDWVRPRSDKIQAKGKGSLQTYWLEPRGNNLMSAASSPGSHSTPRTIHSC